MGMNRREFSDYYGIPYRTIQDWEAGEFYQIEDCNKMIYIGSDLPDEYMHSNYTRILKGANAKAKANAAQGLPELLKIATNEVYEDNRKEKHSTLASMNIARGLARFWANGIGIPLAYGKGEGMAPPAFEVLQMRLWGIVPVPAIIFIVLLIVFQIILSKTRFGRQVYAIGGNKNAAYLSGIKVDRIKIYAFMICAMLSSVAAMIHAAQISQGGPNEGQGYELNAVAACAIGGTSLAGGKGTVFGTLIGALILGMLDNVLGLKGVNSNLQLMVKGFLIIIAVFMQADKVSD